MNGPAERPAGDLYWFPRFFRFGRFPVSSYKLFLCVGVSSGILVSAAVGDAEGLSPLALGVGMLAVAIVGMAGARLYHLALNFRDYRGRGISLRSRSQSEGGWGVLGGLVVFPVSLAFSPVIGIPILEFWDYMAIAIAVGGGWVRFGCICNGCCIGRDSDAWFALRQHDVYGNYRRRVPAGWLEIAWWILACAGLAWLWPRHLPPGSYAFAVLAWYGLGRCWLQTLRKHSCQAWGISIDQMVAAALAAGAGAAFLWRML